MKIAVIHDYPGIFERVPAYSKLEGHEVTIHTDAHNDPGRIVQQVAGCEALVLTQQRVRITRDLAGKLPALKFISQTGRNVYHLDMEALTERGIVVSAAGHAERGGYSSTAELAWGLILSAMRHIPYEVDRLKQGNWQSTAGTRLYGRMLGVYAFGKIGSAAARVGRAFGMDVVCWGREGSTARAKAEGYKVAPSREAFFESADVITLHLPGNKDTRGLVTAADLARMKPTALLVNTSRAPLIEEGALVAALKKGRPGFAAVDVYEQEPVVGAAHPLLGMKNALCTPHLGYCEQDNYEQIYANAIEQLLAYAAGKPINVVNPEAVKSGSRV